MRPPFSAPVPSAEPAAPSLVPIALIVFIDVLGFAVVIPLLPFYAERFGASPALIGALLASYAVCSLVAAPLLGRWSDRQGRKPVLLVSQFGSLAGFVMLALAPSLPWLFAARMVDGLSAGNVATARAWISDVVPPRERTRAFGVISAAFGFGFLLGPAGAGLLARFGPAVPFWTSAALSAASIAATAWLLPPAPPRARVAPATLDWRPVAPRLGQLFAFLVAFSAFSGGFALFCERRLVYGVQEVGLLLAWVGLLGLVMQLGLLPVLLRRLGEESLVRWSLVASAAGYAGLAFVNGLIPLLACLTISGLAASAVRPGLFGLISQAVPPSQQGAVFGLTQSLQSLAMIVAPLVAGGLIHHGWLGGWAWFCGGMMVLALVATRPRP